MKTQINRNIVINDVIGIKEELNRICRNLSCWKNKLTPSNSRVIFYEGKLFKKYNSTVSLQEFRTKGKVSLKDSYLLAFLDIETVTLTQYNEYDSFIFKTKSGEYWEGVSCA
jgi:hypothetical protein